MSRRQRGRRAPLVWFVWGADTRGYLVSSEGAEARVDHIAGGMCASAEEWSLLKNRPAAESLGAGEYAIAGTSLVAKVQSGCAAPYGTSERWSSFSTVQS